MILEHTENIILPANPLRKKRLGQYFTGVPLAKLLASIANANRARSIIDPMAGNGDMIDACLSSGAKPECAVGIEIDPIAHQASQDRFMKQSHNGIDFVLGSAFSPDVIAQLPTLAYDLVITNPPYVRYQRFSHSANDDLNLPDATTIRTKLLAMVELFPSLDTEDRRLYQQLIRAYSGLSDLAVPSWLLCAMLTRVGGTLAMVVPEAWLSRDYAQVIQYLLLRWFKIKYVIEDTNAAWFDDASVKTTLVVAERVERRSSAFTWNDEEFLFGHLSGAAMNGESIVGQLFPKEPDPEMTFAQLLLDKPHTKNRIPKHLFIVESLRLKQKGEILIRAASHYRWLQKLESDSTLAGLGIVSPEANNQSVIPPILSAWLGHKSYAQFISPAELGVNIGQGLRTGANQFFYTELVGKVNGATLVTPNPIFGIKSFSIPDDCLSPVLRTQSELPTRYSIRASELKGRVLVLQRYALEEILQGSGGLWNMNLLDMKPMPEALANFVKIAARTNVGTSDEPKYIPEMSAVKTNVRASGLGSPEASFRAWYMLPEFTPRHRPSLFIARVNYQHPKTYFNPQRRILVDANFSTVWLDDNCKIDPLALLALFNSTWSITVMELSGSVMGGGALKLEASQLRRFPIPRLSSLQWESLKRLGQTLANGLELHEVLPEIDRLIIGAIQPGAILNRKIETLHDIAREQLTKRSTRV